MDAILLDPAMTARAERMALDILARPTEEQADAGLYAIVAYRQTLVEEFPGQPSELITRTVRAFAHMLAKTLEAIVSSGSTVGNA